MELDYFLLTIYYNYYRGSATSLSLQGSKIVVDTNYEQNLSCIAANFLCIFISGVY